MEFADPFGSKYFTLRSASVARMSGAGRMFPTCAIDHGRTRELAAKRPTNNPVGTLPYQAQLALAELSTVTAGGSPP
jgi:hypothetical protein